jgi:hypothetical protein
LVGTFTDANPNGQASEYKAKIFWNIDNSPATSSTGTIVKNGNTFEVRGTHTYPSNGTFKIRIEIRDAVTDQLLLTINGSEAVVAIEVNE